MAEEARFYQFQHESPRIGERGALTSASFALSRRLKARYGQFRMLNPVGSVMNPVGCEQAPCCIR
jgi:hypothetical protein